MFISWIFNIGVKQKKERSLDIVVYIFLFGLKLESHVAKPHIGPDVKYIPVWIHHQQASPNVSAYRLPSLSSPGLHPLCRSWQKFWFHQTQDSILFLLSGLSEKSALKYLRYLEKRPVNCYLALLWSAPNARTSVANGSELWVYQI